MEQWQIIHFTGNVTILPTSVPTIFYKKKKKNINVSPKLSHFFSEGTLQVIQYTLKCKGMNPGMKIHMVQFCMIS